MPLFRLGVLIEILRHLYRLSSVVRSVGVLVPISERLCCQSHFEGGHLVLEVLELCLLALELPMPSLFVFTCQDIVVFAITGKTMETEVGKVMCVAGFVPCRHTRAQGIDEE